MYLFMGVIFSTLAIVCTVIIFKVQTDKVTEIDLGLFFIATILFYLVAIVSFGIESICDRLDSIKHKIN